MRAKRERQKIKTPSRVADKYDNRRRRGNSNKSNTQMTGTAANKWVWERNNNKNAREDRSGSDKRGK
jgi:hypothetical protein